MVHVKPGTSDEIVWQFTKPEEYSFAVFASRPFRSRNGRKGGGEMKRRTLLNGLAWLPMLRDLPAAAAVNIHVYKNPDCGCCTGWVDHLKAEGFSVTVTEVTDTAQMRKRLGLPERFGSCHTAVIGGYVIEGHVPAVEVKKLLASRPKAIGLAVPGMPVGSPGMEMGSRRDSYHVLLVDRTGHESVFATYPR